MNGTPKIIPNDLQLTPKAAINEIPEKKQYGIQLFFAFVQAHSTVQDCKIVNIMEKNRNEVCLCKHREKKRKKTPITPEFV